MAIPRVFVSSTCYDLHYIRENLKFFIKNMGFEPIMSDVGNVFYDPAKEVRVVCQSAIVNSKEPNSRLSIREKKAINKNYSKLGHYQKLAKP